MEALEESQINDKSIMEATIIERQDHSGRFRFKTTLPSGRPLESEWIQESDKSKAGILWAEAVRAQIVQDSSEASAKARRQLKELRTAQAAAPKPLVGVDGTPIQADSASVSPVAAVSGSPIPATQGISTIGDLSVDPSAYVRTQYLTAKRQAERWYAERERADREYGKAQAAMSQWEGILQAMGVNTVEQQEHVSSRVADRSGNSRGSEVGGVVVSSNPADAIPDDGDDAE